LREIAQASTPATQRIRCKKKKNAARWRKTLNAHLKGKKTTEGREKRPIGSNIAQWIQLWGLQQIGEKQGNQDGPSTKE